mmetsp:Transcript_104654/g.295729  ORF Transcript_104654/g.295729 Transcript_104654/m.295729 type:complete len:205 (+) Transcript_104654:1538-2152(+)
MGSVLRVQELEWHSGLHQPGVERKGHPPQLCLPGHSRGRQLAVVTAQSYLLGSPADDWHDSGGLCGLRHLINEDRVELEAREGLASRRDGGGADDLCILHKPGPRKGILLPLPGLPAVPLLPQGHPLLVLLRFGVPGLLPQLLEVRLGILLAFHLAPHAVRLHHVVQADRLQDLPHLLGPSDAHDLDSCFRQALGNVVYGDVAL